MQVLHMLVHAAAAEVWPITKPGAPCNVSVTVSHGSAQIRWKHAAPSDGGLATHYVVKCVRACHVL